MKINFKTLLVVFLVALLGAGLGTYGMMEFYNKTHPNQNIIPENNVISEVQYAEGAKTDFVKAIEKTYDSVVEVTVTYETTSYSWFYGNQTSSGMAKGSGVIISKDGYIVTNNHVVENAASEDAIEIKLSTGEIMEAKLIGKDARTDLAVLKVDLDNAKYVSFADSDQLVLGQDAIAIGNPLGEGLSCSNGIVSALSKEIYINSVYMNVIQTNAAVNEGNSGGGLFDINGNLIGIVNAKDMSNAYSSATVEGMGYAIPSNTVKRIVNELIENGYVKDRAALGISVYTQYVSQTGGVIVSDVTEGGSAQEAGILPNDVILTIDGVEVNSYGDLSKFLDTKAVGDIVEVKVLRNTDTMTFQVTLQQSAN
ncbi:MAG: trypsin-like peptidase domain-containing protein [Erysipelotrichaceae bacterium]|nr:trypsin-like peptidase domain-containing protein [Erysipelotrichaceae bacterium]